MARMKEEVEEELALILYINDRRKLSYEQLISWAGARYNEESVFQRVVIESTGISDAIEILMEVFSRREFSESMLLSKIAAKLHRGETTLVDAVGATYELLNSEGGGTHELSGILYSFVDNYSTESMAEYEGRIRNSNFSAVLNKFNTGEYDRLFNRVFEKK